MGNRPRRRGRLKGSFPQMERLYEETESEFTRNRIRAFMTRVPCQTCHGARLKPEILAVTIKDSEGRRAEYSPVQRADDRAAPRNTSGSSRSMTEQQRTLFPKSFGKSIRDSQFLVEVGLELSLAQSRERDAFGRRSATDPARHANRLRPGRRPLCARRAEHRAASAGQCAAPRHAAPASRPRELRHRGRTR